MEGAVSLRHARGLVRLLSAGGGPLAGFVAAGALLAAKAWVVVLALPLAGPWLWLVLALSVGSAAAFFGLSHGWRYREHHALPVQPLRRSMLDSAVVCGIALALAAGTVLALDATAPALWEVIASQGSRGVATPSATQALWTATEAIALAFPFILLGVTVFTRHPLGGWLACVPPTLILALGAALDLPSTTAGFTALASLLIVQVTLCFRVDWDRLATRISRGLPAPGGARRRRASPSLARLHADLVRWLLLHGLVALALTLLGWSLLARTEPLPNDTFLGILPIFLIPFPRFFAMASILGLPLWALAPTGDGHWPAWQLLPVSRAAVEQHAIMGLLVIGLGLTLLDVAGATLWLSQQAAPVPISTVSGLVPAFFGALMAPAAAAVFHILHFRHGRRGAWATLWAIMLGALLFLPVLIATDGFCFVPINVLGLQVAKLEALGAASRGVLLLSPSLAIAAAAWLAWLASTKLLWRSA